MNVLNLLLITFFLCIFIPVTLFGEIIFLKSGKIIHGSIKKDTGTFIIYKNKTNQLKRISQKKIMRILYFKRFLGKQYLRLTNGNVIEGHIVDEKNSAYIIRKKLYDPKEITINRSDVMHIVRSNPRGLTGKPQSTEITLSWNAPYYKPEYYNIYMKKKKKDAYKLAGKTYKTQFRKTDLLKKTIYYFIVKAVDDQKKESLPSNEIKVKTNTPPTKPGEVTLKKVKSNNKVSFTLSWKKSKDSDGQIKKYAVYENKNNNYILLDMTSKTTFIIKNRIPNKSYKFKVNAIDNDNTESTAAFIRTENFKGLQLSLYGMYTHPDGTLSEILKEGMGGMASLLFMDTYFSSLISLDCGFETGYIHYTGTDSFVKHSFMAPLLLRTQLRMRLSYFFHASIFLSPGMQVNYIKEQDEDDQNMYIEKIFYEPLILTGMRTSFIFSNRFSMFIEGAYGVIFETNLLYFKVLRTGIAFRFFN